MIGWGTKVHCWKLHWFVYILITGYIISNVKWHKTVSLSRYELKAPPDGKWGADKGNMSWNGLLGEVQRRVSKKLNYLYVVTDFTQMTY